MVDYKKIITLEMGKRSGKPCIRGLRITVYDIFSCLASGMSQDEILENFSELKKEDIYACFAYAASKKNQTLYAA